jgi:hypothetical protein
MHVIILGAEEFRNTEEHMLFSCSVLYILDA